MNNKGVQLAIEQVVIIVICVVILSLGIAFAFKIFSTSDQMIPPVEQNVQAAIERALSSGKVVEIPSSTKKVSAKDLAIFNLGIKNDKEVTAGNDFKVVISFNQALSLSGQKICESEDCQKGAMKAMLIPEFGLSADGLSYSKRITIPENKMSIISFGVIPKNNPSYAGQGQYYYNACVCKDICNTLIKCDSASFSAETKGYGFVTFSVIVS